MKNSKNNLNEINTTLDKMIQLENSKSKVNIYKIILLIAACIAGLVIAVALCIVFYKSNFSFEGLISLLLAFFSIFMSVFFYFKTEETSNHFYDMSYDFMKDVSVTLGKIEERFGEKLNNLNDKISHLSEEKEEKNEKLQNVEDEKQKMIDELLDKAQFNESQKMEYMLRLQEKEAEADELRKELDHIDYKYRNLLMHNRQGNIYSPKVIQKTIGMLSPVELKMIKNLDFFNLPDDLRLKAIRNEILTLDGELTEKGEIVLKNID